MECKKLLKGFRIENHRSNGNIIFYILNKKHFKFKADVKKHFKLADEKYQQSKKKLEEERSIFKEKFETLKKETESLKAGNLMLFRKFRNKI